MAPVAAGRTGPANRQTKRQASNPRVLPDSGSWQVILGIINWIVAGQRPCGLSGWPFHAGTRLGTSSYFDLKNSKQLPL